VDRITITGLRAMGRHGADTDERRRPQPFEMNLSIDLDLRAAAASDELSDTVNYAELTRRVRTVVEATSFALLEALAAAVLDAVFEDRRIVAAEVTIAKPQILEGATPSVTLSRRRA
jgi:7,8-dihydroneopterin aldolase/epimerase/oxygenase